MKGQSFLGDEKSQMLHDPQERFPGQALAQGWGVICLRLHVAFRLELWGLRTV